jgi:chromosome segregation ATPase
MQEQRYSRLKNCLLTILELEPELERLQLPDTFRSELALLKQHLEKIEQIEFYEEDLQRLETATAKFLDELRLPFSHILPVSARRGLLQ